MPRLLQEVPGQPAAEQLQADPYLSRFVIIFDREGYSPVFFREMWQQYRIACITYHKYPKAAWPESWFTEAQATMPGGEIVTMKLAEMGSWIGGSNEGLWVHEVRTLTTSGHQTSLVSTAYGQLGLENAAYLFSRWCQENFFRYMMEHFSLDRLIEHGTEPIPETTRLGVLLAGNLANQIFHAGASLTQFRLEILLLVIFMVVLVVGPLLVFAPQLAAVRRTGLREYGTLAQRYVRDFDAKWVRGGDGADEPLLGSRDIQSLADLGNSFSIIQDMRAVPMTQRAMLQLGAATTSRPSCRCCSP